MKFIKGRWFPLVVAIVAALLVAFLYYKGFRITYAPGLENSWDAISGCAAWAGAIGTVAAVFSAIRVADKQNKIDMFTLRFEVIKIIGETLNDVENLKFYVEELKNGRTENELTYIIEMIKSKKTPLLNIGQNLGIKYQYLFEQKTVNRIKWIVAAARWLSISILELESALCERDMQNNTFEKKQGENIESKEITVIKQKITGICTEILSAEKQISIQTGQYMDLRDM